jgi:hypothetical protein
MRQLLRSRLTPTSPSPGTARRISTRLAVSRQAGGVEQQLDDPRPAMAEVILDRGAVVSKLIGARERLKAPGA